MSKLVVILGPTASGKSDLAIKLAKKFGGEIISADSRQVYKGLDIGSGKITKKEMNGVFHYLLDVANPKRKFTVAQFQKLANKKIKEIQQRGNLPFLVGGTGFYIQAVVDNITITNVAPNWKLRKRLEKKTTEELYTMLKKLDPHRAKSIDFKNPRRLIRAIEIASTTIKPIPKIRRRQTSPDFDTLQIGIKKSSKQLQSAIRKRLVKRLNQPVRIGYASPHDEPKRVWWAKGVAGGGMITEVRRLHRHGLSFRRLEELGLEYRYIAQYLQQKITYQEMIEKIQKESEHFASRQMTWFKRDKRIHWVKNQREVEKLIKNFLQ